MRARSIPNREPTAGANPIKRRGQPVVIEFKVVKLAPLRIAAIKAKGARAKKPIAAQGRMIINTGEFCNYTFSASPILDRRGNVYKWHGKARLLLTATQLYLGMFVGALPTEAMPAEPDPPVIKNVIKLSDFKRA